MSFTIEHVSGYCGESLTLPVTDLQNASEWYGAHFGFAEVQRTESQVIMERDGVQIGFQINGRDPEQDGAAILVTNIAAARDALEASGISTANWRVDERDGKRFQVFFVVAPDGLCFYFHEEIVGD